MSLSVFRSRRVVTPGAVGPGAVHVREGTIVALAPWEAVPADATLIDAGEAALLPGVVDTHVHVNEPGRTDWEGFKSATRAAAAGGVTTLVDMPLNSIPATTTVAALRVKQAEARGQCLIDVGFWGGVVPGNLAELSGMAQAGARGFKCFLCFSGVDEFLGVGRPELLPAMQELAGLGKVLLVHAELEGPIDAVAATLTGRDPRAYATYLASRPPEAEEQAVALVAQLCRETGARTHVVHHSASTALPLIRAARAEGLPFSAETCPHYLHFTAERIAAGATAFKCAPPVREEANRELLWQALGEGVLSLVASDHSPCTPNLKKLESGDFLAAWGGISGLQLGLPITWTGAAQRGFGLAQLAHWMSEAPAKLAGLSSRKGRIAVGLDADFTVFEPEARFTVEAPKLFHKNKITPYAGETLSGVVRSTWLRGERVFHDGEPSPALKGHLL